MKSLLLTTGILAAITVLVPPIWMFATNDFFQFIGWMIVNICIGFICFILLLVGLVRYRAQGLWLAIPLALCFVWLTFLEIMNHLYPNSV